MPMPMPMNAAAEAQAVLYAANTPQRRILAAAAAVLIERGFPDTRVADVAKRAEVSPGLVMYYFKSRYKLLTRALRFASDMFYEDASSTLNALEHPGRRLAELMRLSLQPEDGAPVHGSWLLWLDMEQQAVRHPALRPERTQLDRRWRDAIADMVREGQSAGRFRAVDADDFAYMLSAMSGGLAVSLSLEDEDLGHERALALCLQLCAHQLGDAWLDD
ncbi:TetR/AcrR family transcriptional regulator [Streptomyces formicae]|uniref:TetR family transcriptional regulator n=1 Tax=Streptomyces formicae TaxID=1616117 RepID=A0ABY3WKT5_9ACTN|nr:TetR/AcrR family transcriptional regulator [Streptomyces formicae]UNM13219.1 TetR family transcriptional regulator [Streptomyces formicae]